MVKTVAERQGLWGDLHAEAVSHLTGNGAHYHVSLWDCDGKTNLFHDRKDEAGLSQVGRSFMGGILEHAKALAAVTAPIVNSYKRLIRGAPRSGATWAPVYVTYGGKQPYADDPRAGRRKDRKPHDGSANPYLSTAVLLAAGLDGIQNRVDPGVRNEDSLYEVSEEELRRR